MPAMKVLKMVLALRQTFVKNLDSTPTDTRPLYVIVTWHKGHASKRGWQITRILSRFDIFATRIRNEFTSQGRNQTSAIYYLAYSRSTRLDFCRSLVSGLRGRSAGSFPEQQLVIEPKVDWLFPNWCAFPQKYMNKNKKYLPLTCLLISFLMSS